MIGVYTLLAALCGGANLNSCILDTVICKKAIVQKKPQMQCSIKMVVREGKKTKKVSFAILEEP